MKIKKLTVYTSNIESQFKFYRDELGFNVCDYSEKSFEIEAGYSILKFENRENSTPYHIAFHIPDRQEETAVKWLDNKMKVLEFNGDKIIDFSNWQAMSVYFYDKDENIMEFISRRDFKKPESALFSASSIVGIAEIGLATQDISEKFEEMQLQCGLERFDGDFQRFCAVGDSSGLIITINKDKKDWFPTGDEAYTSNFRMEFEHQKNNFEMNFSKDTLEISQL
ncbi:MAG: VOC family protein [Christiangramia sp.]